MLFVFGLWGVGANPWYVWDLRSTWLRVSVACRVTGRWSFCWWRYFIASKASGVLTWVRVLTGVSWMAEKRSGVGERTVCVSRLLAQSVE